MKPSVEALDWGVIDYGVALERQRGLFEELIAERGRGGLESGAGWLVFCEHPPVYTLGRSGKQENLLVSEQWLRGRGAALYRVERGGDITFHGPGQIVVYPVVDLERVGPEKKEPGSTPGMGLRQYVGALEQAVIETVAEFGIEAGRIEGKTGVWVKDRKVAAIGVKASRGVVMHGLALNVATDLGWFEWINPCGMAGAGVTSVEKETGRKVAVEEVKTVLCERLKQGLGIGVR